MSDWQDISTVLTIELRNTDTSRQRADKALQAMNLSLRPEMRGKLAEVFETYRKLDREGSAHD